MIRTLRKAALIVRLTKQFLNKVLQLFFPWSFIPQLFAVVFDLSKIADISKQFETSARTADFYWVLKGYFLRAGVKSVPAIKGSCACCMLAADELTVCLVS